MEKDAIGHIIIHHGAGGGVDVGNYKRQSFLLAEVSRDMYGDTRRMLCWITRRLWIGNSKDGEEKRYSNTFGCHFEVNSALTLFGRLGAKGRREKKLIVGHRFPLLS